jgi:electron transfer flavoprotein alpha subunit
MILTFAEHDRGALNELSLQALTMARSIAGELDLPVHGVLIGDVARPLAGRLRAHGASEVLIATGDDRLNDYAPEAWGRSVSDLIVSQKPAAVLAVGTDRGNEVMAHAAATADLPMAANCTYIRPGNPAWTLTRVRWGGSLLEEAELQGATKMLTIAPHAVAATESATPDDLAVTPFSPALTENDFRARVVGRVEPDRSKIALADAKAVVGGGRGVGSAEGFEILEEIAALLGGSVGCSRAVTSLGWRPHSDQVGQTGTRIAPDVYIACGISGAIQHMVGCKNAKCLVAINKDPDAPIVAQADYAIVGDLKQVLPALRDAIRETVKGR